MVCAEQCDPDRRRQFGPQGGIGEGQGPVRFHQGQETARSPQDEVQARAGLLAQHRHRQSVRNAGHRHASSRSAQPGFSGARSAGRRAGEPPIRSLRAGCGRQGAGRGFLARYATQGRPRLCRGLVSGGGRRQSDRTGNARDSNEGRQTRRTGRVGGGGQVAGTARRRTAEELYRRAGFGVVRRDRPLPPSFSGPGPQTDPKGDGRRRQPRGAKIPPAGSRRFRAAAAAWIGQSGCLRRRLRRPGNHRAWRGKPRGIA